MPAFHLHAALSNAGRTAEQHHAALALLQVNVSYRLPDALGAPGGDVPVPLQWVAKKALSTQSKALSDSKEEALLGVMKVGASGPHVILAWPFMAAVVSVFAQLIGHLRNAPSSWSDGRSLSEASLCSIFDVSDECRSEYRAICALFLLLSSLLALVSYLLCVVREELDVHITPLTPQLIVKSADTQITIPWDETSPVCDVREQSGDLLCRVFSEFPNYQTSSTQVSLRLESAAGCDLAVLLALRALPEEQQLALCRVGCETFGFVVPEAKDRYSVQHRTGMILLTLVGDFSTGRVEIFNPMGTKVCRFEKVDGSLAAHVEQGVDAGLIVTSYLATQVHRRMSSYDSSNMDPYCTDLVGQGGAEAEEVEP
mmetsp:Transcript_21711/g.49410  ORF Transcript_21711/g.49410 Transcript_21711/m.49410 type:complete len:370 (+) Transcript_21711:86-1195(+)